MNYIYTIGDLKRAIENFNDEDAFVVEIHEGSRGEDLYTPHIDIIDNLVMDDGSIINEVRFCI